MPTNHRWHMPCHYVQLNYIKKGAVGFFEGKEYQKVFLINLNLVNLQIHHFHPFHAPWMKKDRTRTRMTEKQEIKPI